MKKNDRLDSRSVRSNSSQSKSMAIATILVMIGLILSKSTGFLRDIFVAQEFTDSLYRDSFTLSFTIPDFFFNLIIGGSIQAALTPSLSSAISAGEEKKGLRAVSTFISIFGVIMLVVCTLGVVFAKEIYFIYSLTASEANSEMVDLAASASRMLFPQIFFMMLAALCIGVLNAYKRFSSTAFGPTIYNVFVLLAIVLFAGNSRNALVQTTAGVMGAAFVYFLFQYFIGFDKLRMLRFNFAPKDPDFIILLKKAVPILISASIVQINILVLNSFATSFASQGQIYALRNASTIWQLPYGVFAVAIGNVMLPSLAALYSENKKKEASELLSSRLKSALFLTIPSAIILVILNVDVVKAIFQWGEAYTDSDAKRAGIYLIGYSIAVITHTVVFIMNQAFYAIGKTKIPLLSGCVGLVANPLLCFLFIYLGLGPISLTFSYSLTSIVQLIILCVIYQKDKSLAPRDILRFIVKSAICVIVMGVIVYLVNMLLPSSGGKIAQLGLLALKCIIAVIVYFACALAFRMKEAIFWIDRVKAKGKR